MLLGWLSRCPSSLRVIHLSHWLERRQNCFRMKYCSHSWGEWRLVCVHRCNSLRESGSDCILVDRVKWQWQVINIIGVLVFTSQPNPHQPRASPTESHICYLLPHSSKLHSWMPPWHSMSLLHTPTCFVAHRHLFSVHCVRHTHTLTLVDNTLSTVHNVN